MNKKKPKKIETQIHLKLDSSQNGLTVLRNGPTVSQISLAIFSPFLENFLFFLSLVETFILEILEFSFQDQFIPIQVTYLTHQMMNS